MTFQTILDFYETGLDMTTLNFKEKQTDELIQIRMKSDYLTNFLKDQSAENLDELIGKSFEVFSFRNRENQLNFTLSKPFPQPTGFEEAVLTGKIKEILLHRTYHKIAIILEDEQVVIKNFSIFKPDEKKSFVAKSKKDRLLNALKIETFDELDSLVGKQIQFVRQAVAGHNYYEIIKIGD